MIKDVELLLQMHGIRYVDNGKYVKCLCLNPKHNDKHIGSFSINKSNGVMHCFACGFKGNIYTLNKILGEKITKEDCGNGFLEYSKPIRPTNFDIKYPKPVVIGNLYNPFYNKKVMDFMHSIGYTDEFIREKEIKYCTYCTMISEDLVNDSDIKNTVMENRICIPIYHNGNLINYECRTFDSNPVKVKYVRGCSVQTCFNYENIDKNKTVIVVESIKNLANVWQINKNVISMFHALPTDYQLKLLNECKELLFYIDNDEAGFNTVKKFSENTDKKFLVTFDRRIYKHYDKEKMKLVTKGYDCADCTVDENRKNINNAIYYDEFLRNQNSYNLFWN